MPRKFSAGPSLCGGDGSGISPFWGGRAVALVGIRRGGFADSGPCCRSPPPTMPSFFGGFVLRFWRFESRPTRCSNPSRDLFPKPDWDRSSLKFKPDFMRRLTPARELSRSASTIGLLSVVVLCRDRDRSRWLDSEFSGNSPNSTLAIDKLEFSSSKSAQEAPNPEFMFTV